MCICMCAAVLTSARREINVLPQNCTHGQRSQLHIPKALSTLTYTHNTMHTQYRHAHTHLYSWYTDADKRRIVNRKTAAVEWLSVVGAATFRAPLASFYNAPTMCVCVCVRVGAYVCVHVAFAVLPLHTHSTLIDPTASSNKGFDFQHDKRQSQSSAGPAGSIICFAKPTSQSTS